MKRFLCVLLVLCAGLPVYAQTLLPQFFDNGNAGTEYYITFLPTRPVVFGINNIKIYVTSTVETEVALEVKGQGYLQKKRTKPNGVIEFIVPVTVAQPYYKTERDPTPKEAVYRQQAVHIIANDPIIVYGVTRYSTSSEGFLGLPVSSLGTEYIVASSSDAGDNTETYLPSEVGVVAAFDHTLVNFTLGGTPTTRTSGGMKPGETKTFTLNRGDVLVLTSLGQKANLSGSKIISDKPIGVLSGSYCAYEPNETIESCNHLIEMELPTHTWGKEYIVPEIFGRKKNSVLKIMAKEPNTKIFINGQHKNTTAAAGGVEGFGYIVRRPDEGSPANFVVSGDKPISVTQFNPGQGDDGISSNPFQMVLTPVDHFMKDLTFTTPGIGDGSGFTRNYINLVFELDENEKMPKDLEFGTINNGQFVWEPVVSKFGSFFEALSIMTNDKQYGVKTIKLPNDGVYRVRSPLSLAAYSYGFSDQDAYGYPAGASLADLSGGVDTLPPVPSFVQLGNGNSRGGMVADMNEGWNSKLASVRLLTSMSFNYTLSTEEFIPGEAESTSWLATVVDKKQPAKAVITFIDRAGNDTTITLEYNGIETSVDEPAMSLLALNAVSPNPTSQQAFVHYSLAVPGRVQMSLYNALGTEVQIVTIDNQPVGNNTLSIYTGDLPPGMYVCRLTSGNTTVSAHLVVVH